MSQFLKEDQLRHAQGIHTLFVDETNTAIAMGSGTIKVCATPAIVASAEAAAVHALAPFLPPGTTTVGTHIDLRHLSATPIGMTITSTARIINIINKEIVFAIESYDEKGLVSTATHTRYLITTAPFIEKAYAKKK